MFVSEARQISWPRALLKSASIFRQNKDGRTVQHRHYTAELKASQPEIIYPMSDSSLVQSRIPYKIGRRLTHPSVVASKGNAISTSIQNSIEALAHAYVVTILAVCVLFGRFVEAIQSTRRYHVVAL